MSSSKHGNNLAMTIDPNKCGSSLPALCPCRGHKNRVLPREDDQTRLVAPFGGGSSVSVSSDDAVLGLCVARVDLESTGGSKLCPECDSKTGSVVWVWEVGESVRWVCWGAEPKRLTVVNFAPTRRVD